MNLKANMRKWVVISVIFLIVITTFRLLWLNYLATFDYSETVAVEEGVIDLRDLEFTDDQTLPLSGEWEFYPSQHIHPDEFESTEKLSTYKKVLLETPNNWGGAFSEESLESFRYGTYRLKILLGDEREKSFAFRVNQIRNASEVFINGESVHKDGQPAMKSELHEARNLPYSVYVEPNQSEIDLVIHVSNHTFIGEGGITEAIRFGTAEAIDFRTSLSVGLQLLLCIVLLIHGLYGLILFFLGGRNRGLLYFSIIIVCALISVLVSDDKLLFVWFDFPFEWQMNAIYLSYIGAAAFIPFMIKNLISNSKQEKIMRWFAIYCILFALIVLVTPYSFVPSILRFMLSIVIGFSLALSIKILVKGLKDSEDFIFLIITCLSLVTSTVWPIVTRHTSADWMHYPFDLIIAILALSAFWIRRFIKATDKNKVYAEKLRQENERKDEFLVNTSHELRNPLHVIMNLTNSILENKTSEMSHEHKNRLEIMSQVSQRMSLMLDDLIDVTRLKEKTVQLKLTPVNVQSIVSGVIDMVRILVENKPIQLKVDISKSFPAVYADENRIIQVLFNLVHNAVKYTNDGTITIRARLEGEMARIDVEDSGIGIDEKTLQTIFHPYERGNSHLAQAKGGFGIGLSISKQLVELHGGTILVASTVGEGSVFSFTLPLATASEGLQEENPLPIVEETKEVAVTTTETAHNLDEKMDGDAKPKLLIVDDDRMNLNVFIHLFETENYDITIVTSAKDALKQLENIRYDLVIADVMMPKMSGYELTQRIRERFTISELPILLLTARTRLEDIMTGFQYGANDYVSKPVNSVELKMRVRALINLKLSVEKQLRMEGAWLQSQIQPHFLYNTLNSIAALGMVDVSKMQSLLEEFSNYLRLSFDFKNVDQIISLKREIDLVRSYVYIEKERFGDRVQIDWEIDPNINFKLPPLTIQPLVENAINHGLLSQLEGGTVCIRITENDDLYEITVSDDGKGMTSQENEQIFSVDHHPEERKGIGLLNIDRRLKQLYGKGLSIESTPNQGTVVSFQIYKK